MVLHGIAWYCMVLQMLSISFFEALHYYRKEHEEVAVKVFHCFKVPATDLILFDDLLTCQFIYFLYWK